MQRFWSSFNNWITISLEKWPRTEEKKLIFIWHLNTDTCWSVVITAITRWVSLHPLLLWHWQMSAVKKGPRLGFEFWHFSCLQYDTSRESCVHSAQTPRCLYTLRYARFPQTPSWNGETQYSCALERYNNILLQVPTQPSLISRFSMLTFILSHRPEGASPEMQISDTSLYWFWLNFSRRKGFHNHVKTYFVFL